MALLLRPHEHQGIITMKEAIDAVTEGFREWGANALLNAPRRRVHAPSGVRVSVHQGAVPGMGATGLMTHCEWVRPMAERQVYDNTPPPVTVIYSAEDGTLEGVIVGELSAKEIKADRVVALRTAATSIIGTHLLARPDATRVGLFGSGGQAKNHLVALATVRRLTAVKVFSPNQANREAFAAQMRQLTGIDVVPVSSAQACVEGSEIIITATSASVPVFDGNLLQPGQHVTSIVGSNIGLVQAGHAAKKRRELDDSTITRAHVIVVASKEQVRQDQQADLYDPIEAGLITWDQIHELGGLLNGHHPGRTSQDQITLFKNNAGQGVADVSLGSLVLRRAKELGLGQVI